MQLCSRCLKYSTEKEETLKYLILRSTPDTDLSHSSNIGFKIFCRIPVLDLLSLEELAIDMAIELGGATARDGFPLPGADDDILAENGVSRADETEGVCNSGGLSLRGFYLRVGQSVDRQAYVEDLAVVVHVSVVSIVLVVTAEIIDNQGISSDLRVVGDEAVSEGWDLDVVGSGSNEHRSTRCIS